MWLPATGVYAGRALVEQATYPAAINIGPNPTFAEQTVKFEVHLIGFARPLYGKIIEVEFLDRIRDVRPFSGIKALQQQLAEDSKAAQAIAAAAVDVP
jgi:riboflavin kinase/FMN adenylyltransferase